MNEDQLTMAEHKSHRRVIDRIRLESLGRIAKLGDLYDATTDTFCEISIFREQLSRDSPAISVTDKPNSRISTSIITSSIKDKLRVLGVTADLGLSVLAGLCELGGGAKYLDDKKTSFKSVECALVYSIKTVVENLNIFHEEVKNCIYMDALTYPTATHVVVGIDWGANCTIKVTDQNGDDVEKKEVERNLIMKVNELKSSFPVSDKAELLPQAVSGTAKLLQTKVDLHFKSEKLSTQEHEQGLKKFSLEIFGDVLLDSSSESPTTVEGAMEIIKKLPQLIQTSNDGKGKPVTYVMFPLSSPFLRKHLGVSHSINRDHTQVDEAQIVEVIRIFDDLSEFTQKAHDHLDKMNDYSQCVTTSELKGARSSLRTLEDQEARLSSELKKVVVAVRSGNYDAESLISLCHKHRTSADETFEKFENIYDAISARILFAERCKKYGAMILTPPVDEQIQSACDDHENVFVLFDGEADRESTQRNHSAFIELARIHQNDNSTACYVTWLDKREDARIKHYRKKENLFREDVAKELEAKDMAKYIPEGRAFRFEPFKGRCPGSFNGDCSPEERSWICLECNQTLQFFPEDAATLYCNCGKATTNQFEFRCHNKAHGSQFTPYDIEKLQRELKDYQSSACWQR